MSPATTIATFTMHQARTQLGDMCDTVQFEGEHVLITRRGRPVAEAIPPHTYVRYCDADGTIDPRDAVRLPSVRRATSADSPIGTIDWSQIEDTQIELDATTFRMYLGEIVPRVSFRGMHVTLLRRNSVTAVLVDPEWAADMRRQLGDPHLG